MTKRSTPSVSFFMSRLLLMICREAFISHDHEPLLLAGRQSYNIQGRCMNNTHATNRAEAHISKPVWKTTEKGRSWEKGLPFHSSKEPSRLQVTLPEAAWEDSARNAVTSCSYPLPTRYWNDISRSAITTALFLCVAMEFQKQNKKKKALISNCNKTC